MFFTQFVLILTLMLADPSHPNGMSADSAAVGYAGDVGVCVVMIEKYKEQYREQIEAKREVLGYSFDCIAVQPLKPPAEQPLKDNEKRS